jgi:small subunit ribosomal protein S1
MKEALKDNDRLKPLRVGQIVKGEIVGRGRSALFLDIGPFGTGIIYGKEFYSAKDELKSLEDGEKVSAKVVGLDNEQGYVELSVSKASEEISWEKLKEKKEKGEIIPVKISGANKGGLLTKIHGIQGFIPVSQLSTEHYPRVEGADSDKILKALQEFVGEELKVKVFDLSKKERRLILSEKAKESEKIKEILKDYKIDQVVDVKVTGVTDFGAFVRFGEEGLEGLIHISELDWSIVEDPGEIVQVGDKIKAKIIEISDDKVFLSLKALKKDPWEDIEKKYKKEDVVSGKVVKFNPFGAFIQIEDRIQGLIHISEFGTERKMEEELKIGEKYKFKVLSIEPEEHKITLSLEK